MLARFWTKPFAIAALLITCGAVPDTHAQQSATGSLVGKLTDTYSKPVEGASVILHNETTGAEFQFTTTRGGNYRFDSLAVGEYSLLATSRTGQGQVRGVVILAGHESRLRTAIQFSPILDQQVLRVNAIPASVVPKPSAEMTSVRLLQALIASSTHIRLHESAMPAEVLTLATSDLHSLSLDLPGVPLVVNSVSPNPVPIASLGSQGHLLGAALVKLGTVASQFCALPVPSTAKSQMAPAPSDTAPSSASMTGGQLQSLPLAKRNWQNYLLDSHVYIAGEDGDKSPRNLSGPQDVTVDGVSIRLAFGAVGVGGLRERGATLIGPGSNEAAIRQVQSGGVTGEPYLGRSTPGRANVETQRGTNGLHGQAFLFDRQNVWGAQNPFTQWVQQTAPASIIAIPTFTPESYSPGDRESTWGLGAGGFIRRDRLFWFLSIDSNQRNDPGVASVKHANDFFAQPSNDQMQVLSARLGLSSVNPVAAGIGAYSTMLEKLDGLLGLAARTSKQWTGFGRLDWKAAERHRFTLEGTGARLDSPGGGLTRASETFGSHSFGSSRAGEEWMLGRWEAFLTPNVLAVTQGSLGHQIQDSPAEKPSPYEQTLNINAWAQLPQIVVDSRYGFTIGNPARFGPGSYPDEHLYDAQEQLSWVRGPLLLHAGFEFSHNTDATSQLRNQTGTYYYSSVENFASDALAFADFGLNGQLDPMNQHNCDQTGKVWRDSTGTLHGLGYLPCYSYYSQTMGPADWWLSTNDWASYVTSQWQPQKQFVLSVAMRWEREQLPAPIPALANSDLPLTQALPNLGNKWGPRVSAAWGSNESNWPVLRVGYGMYFGRTQNAVIESALTQTGSVKGDLNFFMRPTDNLNAGGAPPFPYVLAGEPSSIVKPGAVGFAPDFRNGEVQQADASIEQTLPGKIHVEAGAVASLGRRLPVTLDANIDPSVNPKTITYAVVDGNGSGPIKAPQISVPFYASWPNAASASGFAGRLNPNYQQVSELFSRANSTYEAAILRLTRDGRSLTLHARYTYAHAMDWNPNENAQVSGSSVLDPIDLRQEYGTSDLDVRHSASIAVISEPKWKLNNLAGHIGNGWMLSGIGQFHSGLPYTMRTTGSLAKEFDTSGTAIVALSTGMNGYGGDNRVYTVGRNTYRYPATWKADMRLGKRFDLGGMRQLELLAESFNLFNHQNVTELETTGYSIESGSVNGSLPTLNFLTGLTTGQTEFGKPLNINATDFYRERQIQFGARLRF